MHDSHGMVFETSIAQRRRDGEEQELEDLRAVLTLAFPMDVNPLPIELTRALQRLSEVERQDEGPG